ncbi:hypothetical protein CCACVL1_03699 [Corchorus capsularis]|uniref:Cyclic nucleotide-binding domain-containing protein n=1 Tax=Corchorus capsularis TaxID=210143 RepID=A0A1R3JXU1_COCAP|nr:hypothetical protein CCACVL1_03699 [Corchorus capsularis]
MNACVEEWLSQRHKIKKKLRSGQVLLGAGWAFHGTIFLLSSVISVSLDPLFFYLPVVNEDKKCLFMDGKLGTVAIILRSVMDGLCIISVACRVFVPYKNKRGNPTTDAWSMARSYFPSSFLLVEILAVLPLPQILVLVIIPIVRDVKFLDAMNSLAIIVICQSIPRILRIYAPFKRDGRTSDKLAEAAWAKAACNLLLYMLAGHALGALWYFLAIERETACWLRACANTSRCVNRSFYCNNHLGDHTFINESCPISNPDPKLFDFGIYLEALQSGVSQMVNFPQKYFHCFHWGLQNLSSLGQNLSTSTSIGEDCFAVFITMSGLLLFLYLIGNVQVHTYVPELVKLSLFVEQIYLQLKTMKSEELRLKTQEIEQWKLFKQLPDVLQNKIKKYQKYKWQESRGVDVEKLLYNLPKDLRIEIKRHLFFDLVRRVPLFYEMDHAGLLESMCDRLKPVLCTEMSYIVREGDAVEQMLFITQGKLVIMRKNHLRAGFFNSGYLGAGDFCGEELLTWALDPHPHSSSNLPISTTNLRALTEVEAYALMAEDLKFVASQFRRLHGKRMLHIFRFYSQEWRIWAAFYIQAAWRRYINKKLEKSLREEENRLQDALANAGGSGSSLSFGATIYAARFAANALHARKARVAERLPPMLPQKPAEPDVTDEEF